MRRVNMISKMVAVTVAFALLCPGMVYAQMPEEAPDETDEELTLDDGTDEYYPDTVVEDGSDIVADTDGVTGTGISGKIILSELSPNGDYYLTDSCKIHIDTNISINSIDLNGKDLYFYEDSRPEGCNLTVTEGIYGEGDNNDYNGKIVIYDGCITAKRLVASNVTIYGGNIETSELCANNIEIGNGSVFVKREDIPKSSAISSNSGIVIKGGSLSIEDTVSTLAAMYAPAITISGGSVTANCKNAPVIRTTDDLTLSGGCVEANSGTLPAVMTLSGNINVSGRYTRVEATTRDKTEPAISAGVFGTGILNIDQDNSVTMPEGGGISKDGKYITATPGAQSEEPAQQVVIENPSDIPAMSVSGPGALESEMKATANKDGAQVVYYGKYNDRPCSWFVIGYDDAGNEPAKKSGAMTLLSEENIISANRFSYNDNGDYGQSGLLYKNGVISDNFAEKEKKAVIKRELNDIPTPLTDGDAQFIWPLSVDEAEKMPEGLRKTPPGTFGHWWLRTPGGTSDRAGCVNGNNGEVIGYGDQVAINYYGARPAFYLDLDSVLFTSSAVGGKNTGKDAGADSLTQVGTNSTRRWKLTLKDDGSDGSVGDGHKGFKVTTTDFGEVEDGQKAGFDYEGAATGDNEFISAILVQKNAEDKIIYYGRLKNTTGSGMRSGTQTVTIPEKLYPGDYILKVFSEQYNGDKMTDLASGFCDISFTVKKWTPSSANFNVKLPESSVYDGKPREALAAPAKDVFGMGFITTKYKDEHGKISTEAPTQPGTYTVCLDVDDGNYYKAATDITDEKWTFTIKPVPATGISISEKEIALCPGETHKLTAKVEPEEVTDKSVKWTSDKESIATVDDNGTVTAVTEGEAIITVATGDGAFSDTCKVTVKKDPEPVKTYTVTVKTEGEGTATASPTTAESGKKITVKATPKAGHKFKKWTATKGVKFKDATKASTSFTMPAKNVTVKAVFEKIIEEPQPELEPVGDDKIILVWWKVKEAKGYDIFMSRCNHGGKEISPKLVKTIEGNETFTWTATGLKPNKSYKALIKAYVTDKNGKKKYISKSPLMHVYTAGGNKTYSNAKSVKLNTSDGIIKKGNKLTLKVKDTYKIKASVRKADRKKKLLPDSHVKTIRYRSSDPGVATVSSKGKITAKKKGKCNIYVYAHNGVNKTIKVTVK